MARLGRLLAGVVLLTVLVTTSAFAQGVPDLSGKWKLDARHSTAIGGARGRGAGGGGQRGGGLGLGPPADQLTITQDRISITIVERGAARSPRFVLRLDGEPAPRALPAGRGAPGPASTVTTMVDGRITTLVTMPAPGGRPPLHYEEVRYLDPDGALVVEIAMTGRPNMRRVVYTKAR